MLFVSPVTLDLAEQLEADKEFRAEFFRLAGQETIASQIRYLRELRSMRQADLANAAGMKQSAISRIERADYASWTYSTLVRVAEALDARMRVTFEPAEDVVRSLRGAERGEENMIRLLSPPPDQPKQEKIDPLAIESGGGRNDYKVESVLGRNAA